MRFIKPRVYFPANLKGLIDYLFWFLFFLLIGESVSLFSPFAFLFIASLLLTLSSFFRKELWLARSLGKGQI